MKKILLFSMFTLLAFAHSSNSYAVSLSDSKKTGETTSASATPSSPAKEEVSNALDEFKSLSRKEKKNRFKEVKKELKHFMEQRKAGDDPSTNTLLLVILALLIPPLAVYLHEGETNSTFWINVLLTILGFVLFGAFGSFFLGSILGIIHALIVILGNR